MAAVMTGLVLLLLLLLLLLLYCDNVYDLSGYWLQNLLNLIDPAMS
jgi:hypothetical protein